MMALVRSFEVESSDMITLSHHSEVFPLFQHDGQEFLFLVEGRMDYHHGGQTFAMRIWLDRKALAARGLAVNDVSDALRAENLELPAGSLDSVDRQFTVRPTLMELPRILTWADHIVAAMHDNTRDPRQAIGMA